MTGVRLSLRSPKSSSPIADSSQADEKHQDITSELSARMKMPNRGLSKVMVSYANRSLPGQVGLPLHGFTVVEGSIPTVKTRFDCVPDVVVVDANSAAEPKDFHAKVFNFATSFVSYETVALTEERVKKIQDSKISDATKKLVASKKGQTYSNSVELFKALFFEKFPIKDVKEVEMESIRLLCTQPYIYYRYHPKTLDQNEAEWGEFARELSNIRDELDQTGVFAPCPSGLPYTKNDEKAFERVGPKNVKQSFPSIHPVSVYEMFDLEMRGTRYILDSLAGTHFTKKETAEEKQARLQKLRQRASYFSVLLYKQGASTNCNKSTASFLGAAAQHSQVYQWNRNEPKPAVSSATLFSPGSSDRMFLWSECNLPNNSATAPSIELPKAKK